MKRPRPLHIALIVVGLFVLLLCFATWWLIRPPAPAPPGMAARLEAEQRAFIESVWPEGEAAWPLLERALAAEGEERVRLAVEASERERLYASLDLLPGGSMGLSAAPFPSTEMRFLTHEVTAALWDAMANGDADRAASLLRASMRLHVMYLQHTGLITTMSVPSSAQYTLDVITDALRQVNAAESICRVLIDGIKDAQVAVAVLDAPTIDSERLEGQIAAVAMRGAMRGSDLGDRIGARWRSFRDRPDGFDRIKLFNDDWILWTTRYNALELERVLDDYYKSIETWWATPALERSAEPDYPGDTSAGPWLTTRRIWLSTRFVIDQLTMQEAGVILLLRIEAHHARTGAWPAALEDAASADEIIDPVTGRAFHYERVADPAPGAWPFVLRAPLTVEEYGRLMMLGEGSRPVEELWREAVTITKEAEEESLEWDEE